MNWQSSSQIAVVKNTDNKYPEIPPFHPPAKYPELSFLPDVPVDENNSVYSSIRETLNLLFPGAGNPDWNPLAEIVSPGDTVVLKPNFIKECHETKPDEWEQVITHGSVIRAVCDYVLLALKGKGKIIICDAPQTDSSFDKICRVSGTKNVVDWYNSWSEIKINLLDLRKEEWQSKDDVIINRQKLSGDPEGYVAVNLGKKSEFYGINPKHGFYGADYDTSVTHKHHHDDVHEYLLASTVMNADVVINLPKLKTHKKTGITCAIKNLVGINGDKNWLPHYVLGSPENGGDQFPKSGIKESSERVLMTSLKKILYRSPRWVNQLFRPVKKIGKIIFGDTHKIVRSGNWHGNDTTWRMAVDLNKCFFYFDTSQNKVSVKVPLSRGGSAAMGDVRAGVRLATPKARCQENSPFLKVGKGDSSSEWQENSPFEGGLRGMSNPKSSRKYLALIDGIIAGEGEGPLAPDAKPCGLIIAGQNPVAVDATCAWLMGFDINKIQFTNQTFKLKEIPLTNFPAEDVDILSNEKNGRENSVNCKMSKHSNSIPISAGKAQSKETNKLT
jgi:uncharacterized protein (DUF362 family)